MASRDRSVRLSISIFAVLISILACEFVQQMGNLTSDGVPMSFVARGETNHRWQATIRSNTTYEVVVVPENENSSQDGARIVVCSQSGDVCPENAVLAFTSPSENGATARFESRDNTTIYIHVFASLEERGNPAGEYSILLQEVDE